MLLEEVLVLWYMLPTYMEITWHFKDLNTIYRGFCRFWRFWPSAKPTSLTHTIKRKGMGVKQVSSSASYRTHLQPWTPTLYHISPFLVYTCTTATNRFFFTQTGKHIKLPIQITGSLVNVIHKMQKLNCYKNCRVIEIQDMWWFHIQRLVEIWTETIYKGLMKKCTARYSPLFDPGTVLSRWENKWKERETEGERERERDRERQREREERF